MALFIIITELIVVLLLIIILYWSGSRSLATYMQLTWGSPYTVGVAALIDVASSRLVDIVF